jgi:antitoxin ParD1/3/4
MCRGPRQRTTKTIRQSRSHQAFYAEQRASGDFQNASELVRDAHRIQQLMRNRILAELRDDIAKGWDVPASNRNVKDIIAAQHGRNA